MNTSQTATWTEPVANFLKKIDIIYWFLQFTLYLGVWLTMKKTGEKPDVRNNVRSNLSKQTIIIYLAGFYSWWAFPELLKMLGQIDNSSIGPIVAVTMAVYTGMEVAWYVISFGAVPKRYLGTAMLVTFLMLLSLTLSATIAISILFIVLPPKAALIFATPIFIAWLASLLYDTMDLLKAGIDEESLIFYRNGGESLGQVAQHTKLLKEMVNLLKTQMEQSIKAPETQPEQ